MKDIINYSNWWFISAFVISFFISFILLIIKPIIIKLQKSKKYPILLDIYVIINFALLFLLFSEEGRKIYDFLLRDHINPIDFIIGDIFIGLVIVVLYMI